MLLTLHYVALIAEFKRAHLSSLELLHEADYNTGIVNSQKSPTLTSEVQLNNHIQT